MSIKLILYPASLTVFFVIGSIVTVWSQDGVGNAIALSDVTTLEELASVGGELFAGKGQCAQCHSLQSESTETGPTLMGVGAKLTREFLYESLVDPDAYIYLDFSKVPPAPYDTPMPPVALTDGEVLAVIAYLQQLSGQPITIELSEIK